MRDKPMWKQFWLELPKYICSKIWLSRNRAIFRNTFPTPIQVVGQPKGLLLETLKASGKNLDATITKNEIKWIGDPPLIDNTKLLRFPKNHQRWKIRISIIDFEKWRKSQNKNCLFFDGASRSNPGEERVRGVLYSNDGNTKLGTKSNNHE